MSGTPIPKAQIDAAQAAIQSVLGGPRSLVVPASLALEALAGLLGQDTALTLRSLADASDLIAEGRQLAEPPPAREPFRPWPPYQVERLQRRILLSLHAASERRKLQGEGAISTGAGWVALGSILGQLAAAVEIPEAELRTIIERGMKWAEPLVGQVQAAHAVYRAEQALRRRGAS